MKDSQILKEVRWALWLTLLYIFGWAASAYLLPNQRGILGFPIWFEVACIFVPLIFILLISFVVRTIFKKIELESKE